MFYSNLQLIVIQFKILKFQYQQDRNKNWKLQTLCDIILHLYDHLRCPGVMLKSFFNSFFQSELKIKLLLLLISILAYWEISLLQFSVKWDMLDVILPWRFHVGECLRHYCFPFWNPYQSAGYPIHADLQCPTWYPETILIGSIIGYSNITLHILFTLYIFIAGLGIFKLTKHFGTDNLPAFISGFAFILTGIFVSHAQHLFIIVSLA